MDIEKFKTVGLDEGWLHETDSVNRLHLDGADRDCRVYEVRIDKLRYNVQNGRIATFVSRYKSEHGELPEDRDELNNVIEKMVIQDNPNRLAKTQTDIRIKGQQEVAVILSDGTVIDGNRRFTCLRRLSRDEGEQRFLRCYIFPDTYDRKAIKGLELDIQLGRDEKVNYDAIARLVDIHTWVNEGPMSRDEYALHAGMKPAEMTKALKQIDAMNDFLEFIDAPGAYHVAQDMKLQAPFESLAVYLGKCKTDDQREEMKQVVFANCLTHSLGDSARASRKLCEYILASQQGDRSFVDEQLDIAEEVLERLEAVPEDEEITSECIRDVIAADDDLKLKQRASREMEDRKAGNRAIKNLQVRSVQDALQNLESISSPLLDKLAPEQLQDMQDGIDEILTVAEQLKMLVGVAMEAKR